MPRRKREKLPLNSREAKVAGWDVTPHNAKPGAGSFKKRLRSHYNRREDARRLQKVALSWVESSPPVSRPQRAVPALQPRRTWTLDNTLEAALREAGL